MMGYTLHDKSEVGTALIRTSRRLLLRTCPELAEDGETALNDAEAADVTQTWLAMIPEKFTILDEIHSQRPDESAARSAHAELQAFAPREEDAPFQRYEARQEREARAAIGLLIKLEKTGEDLAGLEHEAASAEPEPEAPTEPKPVEPVAPNEPKTIVTIEQIMPVTKSDRDAKGRTWANTPLPKRSDLPRTH